MKKIFVTCLFAATLSIPTLGVVSQAQAQQASSERQAKNAITFRQSLFQLIRSNIGPLGAMAKGQIPYNEELMAKNAERMAQLAAMIPDYLELDTSKFNAGSDAKADIWQNRDDFNAKAEALYDAAVALQSVVASKDTDAYRGAIGDLSASCKACHDDYKAEQSKVFSKTKYRQVPAPTLQ